MKVLRKIPQNRILNLYWLQVVQSLPAPSQGSRQQPNLRRLNRRQEEHDRFGLMGLMGVINSQDPDLRILAVGTDLTLLGLPLNSAELVYKTFANPWADNPIRAEPTFKVAHFLTYIYMQSSRVRINSHRQGFYAWKLWPLFPPRRSVHLEVRVLK